MQYNNICVGANILSICFGGYCLCILIYYLIDKCFICGDT